MHDGRRHYENSIDNSPRGSTRRTPLNEVASSSTPAPSRTQLSVAATFLVGLAAFGMVMGPRRGDVAEASDPQPNSRYDSVARADVAAFNLGSEIAPAVQEQRDPSAALIVSRAYPTDQLDRIRIGTSAAGTVVLPGYPALRGKIGDRFVDSAQGNNFVFYTLDPKLQSFVQNLVKGAKATHVAVVAMNPRTGAILAMAGKSPSLDRVESHAGFPAASLFKVVTAAAAVEQAGITPESLVAFRGGTYALNEANYLPDPRRDRRQMTVADALGRSCNPVFGHLGLRYLNGDILGRYAKLFGFNRSLRLEAPLPMSTASIPAEDKYELSRTAAGFGEVRISPIHAAALMSGVANGGLLPRPQLVEKVISPDGAIIQRARPEMLQRIVSSSTAGTVLQMMQHTTTMGTSRREFMIGGRPTLGNIEVAAKTGTLRGENPVGLNNWFIAAAPISNPELAVAVITVDPGWASKASHLGRRVFEQYFNVVPMREPIVTKSKPAKAGVQRKQKARSGYRSIVPKAKKRSAVQPAAAVKSKKKTR